MGGITLGTQRGYAVEQEVVAKLSQQVGLPVSTAMSATVQALKHLKVKSTVIATAYKESINQAVKKYYEDGGIKVLAIKGLEVSKPVDQVKLPDYSSYKVARELWRQNPGAESLLLARPLAHRRLRARVGKRHTAAGGGLHGRVAMVGDANAGDQSTRPRLRSLLPKQRRIEVASVKPSGTSLAQPNHARLSAFGDALFRTHRRRRSNPRRSAVRKACPWPPGC